MNSRNVALITGCLLGLAQLGTAQTVTYTGEAVVTQTQRFGT
jgi:hypothetical protein